MQTNNVLFNAENKELLYQIQEPLLMWYQKNKRSLPWRGQPGAYQIWVSEIMLQQTRVEAVKEYYKRFLNAFPTIQALAEAPEDLLLKMWEGLGYYNRVRNMQKAAQLVVSQHEGVLPEDFNDLLNLPGIGSYTAGAIASIAYQIPVPAVDGNVLRILMRILENDSDISKQSVKKQAEQLLLHIMPKEQPGTYNQALMELGATVCIPNGAPGCARCPVSRLCRACQNRTAEKLPVKAAKKPRRMEEKTVFVIVDESHTVLHKRGADGLLAGLYEIPNVEGWLDETNARKWADEQGFQVLQIERLPDAAHIFSHVEWRMRAYLIKTTAIEKADAFCVTERRKIAEEIAIPSAFAAYRRYLE